MELRPAASRYWPSSIAIEYVKHMLLIQIGRNFHRKASFGRSKIDTYHMQLGWEQCLYSYCCPAWKYSRMYVCPPFAAHCTNTNEKLKTKSNGSEDKLYSRIRIHNNCDGGCCNEFSWIRGVPKWKSGSLIALKLYSLRFCVPNRPSVRIKTTWLNLL